MSAKYFENQLDLLKSEQEEDRRLYEQQTKNTTIQERRLNGLTWYPIAIRGSEISRGDYLTIELERTTNQDLSHQFRSGSSVALFSNHDPSKDRVEGTVSFLNRNILKLTVHVDELPDWASDGKLGIDLLFDDNSYDEMRKALKTALKLVENQAELPLLQVLTGERRLSASKTVSHISLPNLNLKQEEAVNQILSANELAIVHGPPGTGKTTTLVEAIKLLVKEGKKILVVAPSNTAVDLLTEKLYEGGLNVLRIGNPARVSERLLALTVDGKMSAHSSMKQVKQLRKQANEYRAMAHKYKRNFGKAEREQRKALFDEAYKIMQEVEKTEQFVVDDLVAKADVITATPVGSNHYSIQNQKYHALFIDEAGQALEPSCWIPILKAEKVVLAGDHCQLPPTIKSEKAARAGFETTLLEKLVNTLPEAVVMLEEQYRMNGIIMRHSSAVFYKNRLKAHHSVANRLLFPEDSPLSFIDTAGCSFEERSEGASTSNPEEAAFLVKLLELLADEIKERAITEFPSIAIISPYREQVVLLKNLVSESAVLSPFLQNLNVNTIDSFQGQERDAVFISLTRSNSEGTIGFLSDIRRMNVAMTRARKKLVVVGDSATLSTNKFYADFIAFAEAEQCYKSAWEFM